jgi:HD-like signal output (HDOD) protein
MGRPTGKDTVSMNDQDALVTAVLSSGVVLPSPGAGFLRLQAAAADEDAGPREFAAAVVQDPALTGALMRVANSPVFRPRNAPRSALEAITMLGRTRTLATAASTTMRGHCAGLNAMAIEALWQASARAAELSYLFCRDSALRAWADTAYLAALMQDAGVAVLLRRTPEHAHLLRHSGSVLEAATRAVDALTGCDHAAAGFLVARNWKLPDVVCEAIRSHHDPHQAARLADTPRRITLILAVGRRLRDGPSPDWTDWADPVEEEFGVDEIGLDRLFTDFAARD